MKKVKLAIASVLTVMVIMPAVAQADVVYNIGVVSLYKSKGVDQNTGEAKDFRPALQGGVDWTHASGFYVSNWNSTGKFGAANLEIDLTAGYVHKLNDTVSFDISLFTYAFRDQAAENGTDLNTSVSFGAFKLYYNRVLTKVYETSETFGLDYKQPLTDKLTFLAGAGYKNPRVGKDNTYASLGLGYNLGAGLTTKLEISGADESVYGAAGKTRAVIFLNQTF
jgi:uncharacterized protein (TIGR02001 family)